MACRKGCGACCIAISISSPLPGLPDGKPAGMPCIHLTERNLCSIHGRADFPSVCRNLKPSVEMCGYSFDEAFIYLTELERQTAS
ncbi:MAG: YkgJ family cysteine cluster protein [Candidatus Neomarinimicrobiota bacterium]